MPETRCPSCGADNPYVELSRDEIVRTSYPARLDVRDGQVVDGIDGDGDVRELLEAIEGTERLTCQECFCTIDAEDANAFLPVKSLDSSETELSPALFGGATQKLPWRDLTTTAKSYRVELSKMKWCDGRSCEV